MLDGALPPVQVLDDEPAVGPTTVDQLLGAEAGARPQVREVALRGARPDPDPGRRSGHGAAAGDVGREDGPRRAAGGAPSAARSMGAQRARRPLWRPPAKTGGTRMVGVAPAARPAPPVEMRELGAAGLAVARRGDTRDEGHRGGRGHRLERVSVHGSAAGENAPRIGKPRRGNVRGGRGQGASRVALWATPPRSVDAPLVDVPGTANRAYLHPGIVGGPGGAVYTLAVLRLGDHGHQWLWHHRASTDG